MIKEQEQRHIYYDAQLNIEAYNLRGIVQKFPNHFHEFFVIGFIEGGRRHLWCKNREYDVGAGDLILFNPRDNHCCAPIDGEPLDYRAVNIRPEVMERTAWEITGRRFMPHFTCNVVFHSDITHALAALYDAVLRRAPGMEKEEALFFLLEQVLEDYSAPFREEDAPVRDGRIQPLCAYMEEHFSENITLDQLAKMTSFGKSWLLRAFTRQVGVSPYRYLQTIRMERAKKLLEQGTPLIDAAALAGFSDQSHFTHYFKDFTGLTPRQYQRIFLTKPESAEGEKPESGKTENTKREIKKTEIRQVGNKNPDEEKEDSRHES